MNNDFPKNTVYRKHLQAAAMASLSIALSFPGYAFAVRPVASVEDTRLLSLVANSPGMHPPTAPPPMYTVAPDEVIRNGNFKGGLDYWQAGRESTLRIVQTPNGQAVELAGTASQKLSAGALVPGKSYRLTVYAIGGNENHWNAVVRFREPKTGNTFRSYFIHSGGGPQKENYVEFTAPAYSVNAELEISSNAGKRFESISVKMREPLVLTQQVFDWSDSYTPSGYELAFNDEFSGPELDLRKWFTRYIYGGETTDRLNDEKQVYRDNWNHVLEDGKLRLVARRRNLTKADAAEYESGMVRSDWTFRYGFLEARVRMPSGRGVWPAFWLLSDVDSTGRIEWPPEIDVFEYAFNEFDDRANQVHLGANTPKGTEPQYVFAAPGFKKATHDYVAPFDFSKGWHTLAVEWKPHLLNFFVDGKKVAGRFHTWTYTDGTLAAPAHILLNLAIGGSWAGRHGIDNSAFPQALEIDWVRAYQKATP